MLPKIHKSDILLRYIVSRRGAVTNWLAKDLANILKPLVGQPPYLIRNIQDILGNVRNIRLKAWECITSYDKKA